MPAQPSAPADTGITAFIGGGNMARSLVGGLVARGVDPVRVRVAEPVAALRDALARDFGVQVFEHARDAVAGADTWLLAVKPQVMRGICEELAATARDARPLAISIAAGITAAQLDRWLGGSAAVVRAMPNTPALLGAGVSGLHANRHVDGDGRARAETLSPAPAPRGDRRRSADGRVHRGFGRGPPRSSCSPKPWKMRRSAQGLPQTPPAPSCCNHPSARMLSESERHVRVRLRVTAPRHHPGTVETCRIGGLRPLGAAIDAPRSWP